MVPACQWILCAGIKACFGSAVKEGDDSSISNWTRLNPHENIGRSRCSPVGGLPLQDALALSSGWCMATRSTTHYREPFSPAVLRRALPELPNQTRRFFATRRMRDKISDDTLAWYRRMYSDANGGWAHTRTLLRDGGVLPRPGCRLHGGDFPLFYLAGRLPFLGYPPASRRICRGGGYRLERPAAPHAGRDEPGYWVHPNSLAHREAASSTTPWIGRSQIWTWSAPGHCVSCPRT